MNLTLKQVGDLARAVQARADRLGLVWRLRPATVGAPGLDGQFRIYYDGPATGDPVLLDAVSLIGRLPEGARVMAIMSPPAGHHVIGFLGADFPANVAGEQIGRSWLVELGTDWSTAPSTTTPAAVTGMVFTAAPNGRYIVRLRASNNGDTAADVKFSWTVPSGANADRYALFLPSGETTDAAATTFGSMRRIATDTQPAANTANSAPSTQFPGYWEDILVRIGATGGSVQLMAAQNATSVTPTVVRAQSYMEITRYR